MNLLSGLAASAAIALISAATPALAQDKPSAAAANKLTNGSKATKAAKPTWQGPTSLKSTPAAAAATATQDGANAKPAAPEVSRTAPAGENTYKSCHGKESDA
jgi:hypothetical protein